jgi:hypothetical protein
VVWVAPAESHNCGDSYRVAFRKFDKEKGTEEVQFCCVFHTQRVHTHKITPTNTSTHTYTQRERFSHRNTHAHKHTHYRTDVHIQPSTCHSITKSHITCVLIRSGPSCPGQVRRPAGPFKLSPALHPTRASLQLPQFLPT